MDRLVPVVFTVPVQGREHDRQNGGGVVTDQTHDVPETWSRMHIKLLPHVINTLIQWLLTHCSSSIGLAQPPGSGDWRRTWSTE